MAARACVALVALLVLGWLGVMERDARLLARGVGALQPGSSPAELERAESDLRRARLLNPDTAPDFNRALVQRARGETGPAIASLEDVVRREPDNLIAWGVLGVLSRTDDPAAYRRALAARRRLDPVSAR